MSRPLRVLIVTGIFPPDIGGPATYVPTIGRELVKRGHKVTVVTLSDTLDHDDRPYSFRVLRIRRGILKPWRLLLTVAAILRRGRAADVLFVNGLYVEAVIANWFLRKRMVQKVVADWAWERATTKGWVKDKFEDFQKSRHGVKVEALKALRTFCTRRADKVIVPSCYLARYVVRWGVPRERLDVVYNGVEPLNGIQPAVLPIPPRLGTTVATLGRLIPLKQIDVLIEAVSQLDDVGLVVVGDGPERERLEKLAGALGIEERVYFAGATSQKDTLALLSASDLFVLNSTHEGFPYSILEAMSVGLPVVAAGVGGIPEIVRDDENGLLIDPSGNGKLANALRRLASSPLERQRLGQGAKRTAQQFRFGTIVDKTEALLLGNVEP